MAVAIGPPPSRYQQAILDFVAGGAGHGVVQATAGAGKTTALVQVAAALPPGGRAIFLAFARDAARELRRRLPEHVEARTVHSLGRWALVRRLRRDRVELKPPDAGKYRALAAAEVLSLAAGLPRAERDDAVRYLCALATLARLGVVAPGDDDAVQRLAERHMLWPPQDGALAAALRSRLAGVLQRGVEAALQGRCDFTDMLYVPHALQLPPPTFDFVCVDEAQDYSALALELTLRLTVPGGRLLFVGDPRQAIFGFAGADPQALQRIARRVEATVLPLSVSYRCPRLHVELARAFAPEMEPAPGAISGRLGCIGEEQLGGFARPGDLVLCRANAPLVSACLRLGRSGRSAFVRGHDLSRRLAALAVEAFGERVTSPQARLAAFESRARRRLAGSSGGEARLAALQDELACLGHLSAELPEGAAVRRLEELIAATFAESSRAVALSTIHRAKGREAARVLLLAPELLPASFARSSEALQGEACVMFVALTRAREELLFVERDPPAPAPAPPPPEAPGAPAARQRLEQAWAWVRAAAAAGRGHRPAAASVGRRAG